MVSSPNNEDKVTAADRAYWSMREMAMMYKLRPGDTLNEQELARQLNVSRTPLREALNRLASEGFFTFESRRGFRVRTFNEKEVFDLYEVRCQLEISAVQLSVQRASDEAISELENFCRTEGSKRFNDEAAFQLDFDEKFHESLAALSGNHEIVRMLKNINARIRFARWVGMDGRLHETDSEHLNIILAVKNRDADRCRELLGEHISRRADQIHEVIKEGFARIYIETVPSSPEIGDMNK